MYGASLNAIQTLTNVTYLTYEYVTSLSNSGGEGRTQPLFYLIEVQLSYNVSLASGMQPSDTEFL